MIKGWTTIDGGELLSRQTVLDYGDALDAIEEIEEDARIKEEKARAERERKNKHR